MVGDVMNDDRRDRRRQANRRPAPPVLVVQMTDDELMTLVQWCRMNSEAVTSDPVVVRGVFSAYARVARQRRRDEQRAASQPLPKASTE